MSQWRVELLFPHLADVAFRFWTEHGIAFGVDTLPEWECGDDDLPEVMVVVSRFAARVGLLEAYSVLQERCGVIPDYIRIVEAGEGK